jgi:hypothetical protein
MLNGCASQKYFAHLWCRTTAVEKISVGIYTRWDGKLVVKMYGTQCVYIEPENVEVEMESQ